MGRRKENKAISIDVEPFLSIMAIVLKLISLILVVIVMRIAVNPKSRKILSFTQLWSGRAYVENPKAPSYLDCHKDRVVTYPGNKQATLEDLQRPGNPVEQLLNKVQANSDEEYVIVLVRPESVKLYRTIREMIARRPGVDVGYDAMDADFEVNWDEARKSLAIKED